MVYELYYDPSRSVAKASALNSLEMRIAALEKAVMRKTGREEGVVQEGSAAAIVLTTSSMPLSEAITKVSPSIIIPLGMPRVHGGLHLPLGF